MAKNDTSLSISELAQYYKSIYTKEQIAYISENINNDKALEESGGLNDALRRYKAELDQTNHGKK